MSGIEFGAAAGASAAKAGSALAAGGAAMGGAAGLAAVVVMLMKQPRTPREWAVALISTVVSSVGGGAAVVMHFGLLAWADHYMGLVALFGLVFGCGLPGWAIVRMVFNTTAKYQDKGLDDAYRDAKELLP